MATRIEVNVMTGEVKEIEYEPEQVIDPQPEVQPAPVEPVQE